MPEKIEDDPPEYLSGPAKSLLLMTFATLGSLIVSIVLGEDLKRLKK